MDIANSGAFGPAVALKQLEQAFAPPSHTSMLAAENLTPRGIASENWAMGVSGSEKKAS